MYILNLFCLIHFKSCIKFLNLKKFTHQTRIYLVLQFRKTTRKLQFHPCIQITEKQEHYNCISTASKTTKLKWTSTFKQRQAKTHNKHKNIHLCLHTTASNKQKVQSSKHNLFFLHQLEAQKRLPLTRSSTSILIASRRTPILEKYLLPTQRPPTIR